MDREPVWEKTGSGAENSRDKGPHMGVGFKNSKKDDAAMGRIKRNILEN